MEFQFILWWFKRENGKEIKKIKEKVNFFFFFFLVAGVVDSLSRTQTSLPKPGDISVVRGLHLCRLWSSSGQLWVLGNPVRAFASWISFPFVVRRCWSTVCHPAVPLSSPPALVVLGWFTTVGELWDYFW